MQDTQNTDIAADSTADANTKERRLVIPITVIARTGCLHRPVLVATIGTGGRGRLGQLAGLSAFTRNANTAFPSSEKRNPPNGLFGHNSYNLNDLYIVH
jgi:hypothetical protein